MIPEDDKEAEIPLQGVPESEPRLPQTRPFNPQVPQEWTRVALAMLLSFALVGTEAAFLVKGWPLVGSLDDLVKLSGIVLSPLMGIFGMVLGFYFGLQNRRQA